MKHPTPHPIPLQTFRRLPNYYTFLCLQRDKGQTHISAPTIAKAMGLHEVQVRKDLSAISKTGGRPRTGFEIAELLASLGSYLGYHNVDDAILVGAGYLGQALLSYQGFEESGMRIVAGFDNNPRVVQYAARNKRILSIDKLPNLCRRMGIRIGIITVPAKSAQQVCDLLVQNGIVAVWNFAPVHLQAPEHVLIHHENIAMSLALLSQHLAETLKGTK